MPGKAAAARVCIQCHEYERSIAPRQNRAGWQATMEKMIALGARLVFHGCDIVFVKNGLERVQADFSKELGIRFGRAPGDGGTAHLGGR